MFKFILSAAVGFSSKEYTVTESDEFIQLLLFKKGQLRKEIELQYLTQAVHQPHGMITILISDNSHNTLLP